MKNRNLFKRLVLTMLAMLLAASVSTPVKATEEEVRSVADGVLYFGITYKGEFYGHGSCFLINENTIITANHCVHLSELDYAYYKKVYNVSKEEIDNDFGFAVTISRDFTISAEIVNSSENMDFAILTLSQPISNRTILKLRDSRDVQAAETAWTIGFPASKDSLTDTARYYNQTDIAFEKGTINRKQYTEDLYYSDGYHFVGEVLMLSDGTAYEGNSGGPLVDEHGNVIGIVSGGKDGVCYMSAISQVMEILDSVSITYTKADSPDPVTPTTDESTEPSTTVAPTTTAAPETTPAAVVETKSDGFPLALVLGIAGGVVLIAVVVIIILVSSKSKKNSKPAAASRPASQPAGRPTGGFNPANTSGQMRPGTVTPPTAPVGGGETAVLNAGAEGTTVLSQSVKGGSLVRSKTGETISITSSVMTVGRERAKVDYCISGNTSVGRQHAKLVVRDGVTYVVDNNSTNGTFVNGVKAQSNKEIALKEGDRVTFSDEDFIFHA